MAKSAADAQAVALETLAQALADPGPKLLLASGKTPGFFRGTGKSVKEAAKLCEERQWLVPSGEMEGKGKKAKPKYRLGPPGIQAVFQHSEGLGLLRGLAVGLGQQVETLRLLREQVSQLLAGREPLAEAVAQLARKLEPPDVEALLRRIGTAPPAPAPPAPASDWLDEVVRRAAEQRQRDRYQPLSLPDLYAALRPIKPNLTLGQFHDGLRLLRDQGRIRLAPFTRALATIDDARNALFLDGEVMYYVELP